MQINLDHTINSGQVFLWEKFGTKWYGINGPDVLSVDESNPGIASSYQKQDYDLFREKDNFEKIIKSISQDKIIKKAAKEFAGLRLMRQDPFQCYISFIVSSNSSIQNIRRTLQNITIKFGKKIKFDNKEFHTFPEPKTLAHATKQELLSCGLGYRAPFVKEASSLVSNGQIDFDHLKKVDYHAAKESLLQVFGIGHKVADCILLFSLEKLESFPLDRWIIRSLQEYYPDRFSFEGKTLTQNKYQILHQQITQYFGPYAGYCQQFLFKLIRESNQKKWL
ncbi:DNA-3-methyladenine glycosylase family protein [Candidatus Nitrosotenuis aquarius]|uniref:DNA-3-methyladenine glycosylase family protein n=1 Tax=Candidatus Nitrosotenuis aquarius TaxID=1846278 RepID=UPI000C1EC0F4|nr:DNA glycosylase [Candidatus Nitrosotenuis aquarius]